MSKQVLNRPMFAKMRDGSIKPVQYAQLGVFIQGGVKYGLPYLNRFGKYIAGAGKLPYKESASRALTTVKNTLPSVIQKIRSGLPAVINKTSKPNKNVFNTIRGSSNRTLGGGDAVFPIPPHKALVPYGIGPATPLNILKQTYKPALTMSSLVSLPYLTEGMTGTETETSGTQLPPNYNDGDNPEGVSPGAGNTRRGDTMPKEDKKDVKNFDDMLKKGDLDSMIQDKIEIFEKYLGKDVDKRKKSAGYNAMIEFGLNLATARGGNLIDKISRSAKDPMAKFADVGKEILNRAEQIKMAGVEAGITASEKEADRAIDQQAIAADKEIQQMKNDATKMDRQQFMLEYSGKLLTDSDALKQVLAPYKDKDGNLMEGYTTDAIIKGTLENVWQSSQPRVITEELIVMAQNTPENKGMSREKIIQGYIDEGYSLPQGG
tara:strand:- start:3832 stop:5130 length:1299 start_codon:yes stop_codon:yes gene_type:complete